MADDPSKKANVVDADNGRLREELEQLCKKVRPVENPAIDRGGCSLVIRGK